MGGSVLAVAQVTGSLIALGLVGQLNRISVAAVNGIISLLLVIAFRGQLLQVGRKGVRVIPEALRAIRRESWVLVVLGILVVVMLSTLWLGIILPPTDWDGLAQNLPMAAFHVQSASIQPVDTPYRGIRAYPQGGSLLLAYTMLLGGDDTFVDLVQFPFWVLGTLAVFALGRELGAGRSNSFFGSLLFAAAPVTILQARAAYFDLALAGLSLASLALIFDRKLDAVPRALVVGAGAGLIIGLKYAGLINAIVLMVLLAAFLIGERVPSGVILTSFVGFTVVCLALGGCWYALNVVQFGNPFWPMQLQLGGRTLLQGVWTTDTFYEGALPATVAQLPYLTRLATLWREPAVHYAADMRLGGLGPLWFVLGLTGLLLFVIQAIRHPSLPHWGLIFAIMTAFLLTPANWHTRYVLTSIGAIGACVAVMLEQLDRPVRQMLLGIATALACLTLAVVPVHGEARPLDVIRNMQLPPALRRTVLMEQVPAMDAALRWAEQNIPEGSQIAYGWGGVVLYPLFGASLRNHLVQAGPLAGQHNPSSEPAADYVVVKKGSAEEASANQAGHLRRVFSSEAYSIFAVTADE